MGRKLILFTISLLCLLPLSGYAQTITVTGLVIDKYDRAPVWNAYVYVKSNGYHMVQTDEDGCFSIEAMPNDVLVFSFIGYHTQEVSIDGRSTIAVEMDYEDGGYYISPGERQPAHDFSVMATYTSGSWGYGAEYAYLPPISRTKRLFNKILRYTDLNIRVQSLAHSELRFFPHLRVSVPLPVPLFTSRQKLYPFVSAGYYFDTNFKDIPQHGWGVGGGIRTRLAYIDIGKSGYWYMNIHLVAGYTAFINAKQQDNVYLGLRFYFTKAFAFE